MPQATPTVGDDGAVAFAFPAVQRKKVTAAFDGGRLTSDGGVLLLAQAGREMRICEQLAACIADATGAEHMFARVTPPMEIRPRHAANGE